MSSSQADTLKAYFAAHGAGANLRPVLTSLNGDNSWLISFPRPPAENVAAAPAPSKRYFHVVSDPWLSGPSVVLSSWLIWLSLADPPAVRDGAGVEAMARQVEDAAAEAASGGGTGNNRSSVADEEGNHSGTESSSSFPLINAIFINHHNTDHMHKETLETFDSRIPVFATPETADTIRRWRHFDSVTATHTIDPSHRAGSKGWQQLHPGPPLPPWLSVFRVPGHRDLNFGIVIMWSPDESTHEALLYMPHGMLADQPSVQALLDTETAEAVPPFTVLAMLYPLKENFAWGVQTTLGGAGALALDELARPRYWVRTHDSQFLYKGLIMLGVWDVFKSLDEIMDEAAEGKESDTNGNVPRRKPNPVKVDNGGCIVLQ
ncbi:hypothetical protein NKR23_g5550 [Pleurostoma richardsiae]|uniref:Uncharacterized protein n=1 Tax=Pleurostoma richardsiae TaxID=41990 RepID=A0AA38RSK3_9PEZI|nr:hypothetical protein NKR23_g5550 [Pleurostoma richardsiae]